MTTRYSTLALAAALLSPAAPAVAKDKAPADPNRKICHSEVPTGSRMPKRTCHTAAEWAQLEAADSAAAQATLDRATRNGAPQ